MDEATALLETLTATPAYAPTACIDWTAHDVVAHLAAGAAEMAELTEDTIAGRPARPTRDPAEREVAFGALDDAELRTCLLTEALRLNAAVDALDGRRVAFAGMDLTADELTMHGRSEAALHRWDLVGDDAIGAELLSQPELTIHGVHVLNQVSTHPTEAIANRADAAGLLGGHQQIRFGAPGHHDVVLVIDGANAHLELAPPGEHPDAQADPATRLLALWGRRSGTGSVSWKGDAALATAFATFLWPSPARTRALAA